MSHQVTDKELLVLIKPLIQAQDQEGVVALLQDHHPEDVADIFWDIELDEAKYIIKVVEKE